MALVGTGSASGEIKDQMLVRIFLTDLVQIEQIREMGIGVVSDIEGETRIDVMVTESQLDELIRRGFDTKTLMTPEELRALDLRLDPEYHDYEEMVSELTNLESAHPQIAMMESIGVSVEEQRTIWAFKISDNVGQEEDEPAVLYDGVHHACEVMGLEICMGLINDLLDDYGSDPQVTFWVDNTEIWFIPLLNPDGHSAVTDSISLYWRKNGRDLNGNGILYEYDCNDWWNCYTEGANVNRNYDFNFIHGGSGDPWHYDYRGASPFSEDENVAIRGLAIQQRFVLSISYHSYGEVVFYPWSWNGSYAPDDAALTEIAQQIAFRSTQHDGFGTYDYTRNGALSGMSANWFYGTQGTFDFMIEVLEYPYFIIPGSEIDSVYRANKAGALYLLDRVRGTSITGLVSDSITGDPLEARVRIIELYSPDVSPRTSDPLFGRYRWLLTPGTYDLEFSSPGYVTKSFSNVSVSPGVPTVLDVQLNPRISVSVLSSWGLALLLMLLLASAIVVNRLRTTRRSSPTPY
ncbi:MAG: carboxypeptidase regulatory-like domain-containing protein [Candidatus Zixiibacteriota bacterium]|nr:MAG: carboxypeptidase regulatory-like domain-containing protein [candidate division Zixibacteria bacterium]